MRSTMLARNTSGEAPVVAVVFIGSFPLAASE
jgi:hypothetical protein